MMEKPNKAVLTPGKGLDSSHLAIFQILKDSLLCFCTSSFHHWRDLNAASKLSTSR